LIEPLFYLYALLNYFFSVFLSDFLSLQYDHKAMFWYVNKIREPIKYKTKIARDKQSCVIGSVDGVSIAPSIVEPNTTYFQSVNIFLPDNNPVKPINNWKIGIWKAKLVL
jgi:hypothetical protein